MTKDDFINELDKLISLLDEDIDLGCKRIEFNLAGKPEKARFAEERIRPYVQKRLQKQLDKTNEAFNKYKNEYGTNK